MKRQDEFCYLKWKAEDISEKIRKLYYDSDDSSEQEYLIDIKEDLDEEIEKLKKRRRILEDVDEEELLEWELVDHKRDVRHLLKRAWTLVEDYDKLIYNSYGF